MTKFGNKFLSGNENDLNLKVEFSNKEKFEEYFLEDKLKNTTT